LRMEAGSGYFSAIALSVLGESKLRPGLGAAGAAFGTVATSLLSATLAVTVVQATFSTAEPASATARGSTVKLQTRSYAPSSAAIANPDRGFYRYTETHYREDSSGYVPLNASTMTRWREKQGITLVYRIFYLEKFVSQDVIDIDYIGKIRADFRSAAAAGIKLIVRFAYSDTSSADAPVDRVKAHIAQLAPSLNASFDVISILQAGFVGRWGEWYYSDHFASDPSSPGKLSSADWTNRGSVLKTLLERTDSRIFVQVRYPAIKQRIMAGSSSAQAARVGIHNDCFLASSTDYGTFAKDSDYQWLASQARSVPVGGETCAVNEPRSQWGSAKHDLAAYHWSFLNADYNTAVLDSWGSQSISEARRRLGYRLRLTQTGFPRSVAAGARMPMRLTFANDGYAAPFRATTVQLVMVSGATRVVIPLRVDVRTLAPSRSVSFDLNITAPRKRGTYRLYLALPSPSQRLRANPAYAIRLANTGMWDGLRGRHDLAQQVKVV
jgi:hypothetical protein